MRSDSMRRNPHDVCETNLGADAFPTDRKRPCACPLAAPIPAFRPAFIRCSSSCCCICATRCICLPGAAIRGFVLRAPISGTQSEALSSIHARLQSRHPILLRQDLPLPLICCSLFRQPLLHGTDARHDIAARRCAGRRRCRSSFGRFRSCPRPPPDPRRAIFRKVFVRDYLRWRRGGVFSFLLPVLARHVAQRLRIRKAEPPATR